MGKTWNNSQRKRYDMAIRIGIITVSDRSSRGERSDESGPALVNSVTQQGWEVIRTEILPDELDRLISVLTEWADSGELDVILTTGGTGFGPRDVTPEATQSVIQRLAPGLAEAMRSASLNITPYAMLSRATTGIRSHTLIINLPGNPKGAIENLAVLIPVIPHAVQILREDPAAEAGHQKV
jgi:molybdenum cofactor synthesis domain-containing protein